MKSLLWRAWGQYLNGNKNFIVNLNFSTLVFPIDAKYLSTITGYKSSIFSHSWCIGICFISAFFPLIPCFVRSVFLFWRVLFLCPLHSLCSSGFRHTRWLMTEALQKEKTTCSDCLETQSVFSTLLWSVPCWMTGLWRNPESEDGINMRKVLIISSVAAGF